MDKQLQKEFEYFLAHRDELVAKYLGRVVVIRDEQVVGDYDTELMALEASRAKYELGSFLIQRVEKDRDSYTQTFSSRVSFA